MQLLVTLDLQVTFGYTGPLGTFWILWTFRCLLDTLDLQVSFKYLGSLGNFWIPATFRYLLDTFDLQVPFGIDMGSWYRIRLMVQTCTHSIIDMDSWLRHKLMLQTWTHSIIKYSGYVYRLLVWTTPMVLTKTHGIELVLLNHTCTKGLSFSHMQDFLTEAEQKPKVVSAHLQSSKTFNHKRKVFLFPNYFIILNFCVNQCDNGCLT